MPVVITWLKKQFVRIEKTAIMAAVNGGSSSKSRSKNFIPPPFFPSIWGTSVAVKRGFQMRVQRAQNLFLNAQQGHDTHCASTISEETLKRRRATWRWTRPRTFELQPLNSDESKFDLYPRARINIYIYISAVLGQSSRSQCVRF